MKTKITRKGVNGMKVCIEKPVMKGVPKGSFGIEMLVIFLFS